MRLAKIISKLSPLIGNLIEFSTVELLNRYDWGGYGVWERQDPGFPDAVFKSESLIPNPGIEIKAWFPLATEITARFKDSVAFFEGNNVNVALIAWLPEFVIFGRPRIIKVLTVSGKSVAMARDAHYHRPPNYLVLEPEDTSERTGNLRQTNTNGYKLQEDKCVLAEAISMVEKWGEEWLAYRPDAAYQSQLRFLLGSFPYRLDTNYAKIDRIEHKDIERFKTEIAETVFHGQTIKGWRNLLSGKDPQKLQSELEALLHTF